MALLGHNNWLFWATIIQRLNINNVNIQYLGSDQLLNFNIIGLASIISIIYYARYSVR